MILLIFSLSSKFEDLMILLGPYVPIRETDLLSTFDVDEEVLLNK